MNPHHLQLAAALCAGTGTGLIAAAQYYGGRLLKLDHRLNILYEWRIEDAKEIERVDDENHNLRNVIREQEATLSRYHLTMGKPPEIDPATNQMCGGCGAYLTQEEIEACPGEICPRYAERCLPIFDISEAMMQIERKLNIGYTGHLHTSKKPLI